VRRGDGPKTCFNYTMASLATTERLVARSPDVASAAIRAIVNAQAALRENVSLATEVGRKLFPPTEAELIADLIRRDLPFYDAAISRTFVAGMNQFARDVGILKTEVPYDRVAATQFSDMWVA
jgi:NitT/TauT family transport system substrate-binding protein